MISEPEVGHAEVGVLLLWLAVPGVVMTACRFVRSSPGILSQLPTGAGDGTTKALSTGSTESKAPREGLTAMEVGLGSSLKTHFVEGSGREPICRAEGTVDAKKLLSEHVASPPVTPSENHPG